MQNITKFYFNDYKGIHQVPFINFTDELNAEFIQSNLYKEIQNTSFVQLCDGQEYHTYTCDLSNLNGLHYQLLKGDYDYLKRWYHNPFRKANTRHGSYIMLYLIGDRYVWKLSASFITKLLMFPSDINELFDFGDLG